MPASELIIEERTGSLRKVILRGRSLPYQGISFGEKQRVEINSFPGNPVAIAQVGGFEYEPTAMEGSWKDIFLVQDSHAPTLLNFPQISQTEIPGFAPGGGTFTTGGVVPSQRARRAITMRDAMSRVLRGGQHLRVEWGSIVRFGFLTSYVPSHDREEDMKWSFEFRWTGDTDKQPTRVPVKKPLEGLLKSVLAAIDAVLNVAAGAFLQADAFVRNISQNIVKIGSLGEEIVGAVGRMASFALVPFELLGTIKASMRGIILAVNDTLNVFKSISAQVLGSKEGKSPEDIADDSANQQIFRKLLLQLAAEGRITQIEIDKIDSPQIKGLVVVRAGQTLRSISLDQYGTQNNFQALQDFNGFSTSVVPAGTIVRVPEI
jgi:hypothetical protein